MQGPSMERTIGREPAQVCLVHMQERISVACGVGVCGIGVVTTCCVDWCVFGCWCGVGLV